KGKIVDVEYVIYETPRLPEPDVPDEGTPDASCPDTENPDMDGPGLENRPQINKDKRNPDRSKKDLSSTKGSNPVLSTPNPPGARTGKDGIGCGSGKAIGNSFWRTSSMTISSRTTALTVTAWTSWWS